MAIQNANKGLEYFDAGSEELLKIREAEIKRGKGKKETSRRDTEEKQTNFQISTCPIL